MSADVAREIAELLAAGTAVIYLVTHEEGRAVAALEHVPAGVERGFAVWSVHRGLHPTAVEAREPLAVLDIVDSEIGPAVTVLLDFHDALVDKRVVRRLRDVVPRLASERRCVIIVA